MQSQQRRQNPMGILPGGTGNGFAREMGIPKTLRPAVEVLCTSQNVRRIDVGQINNAEYFIQRLYVGIEPEEQTSRAMDKYGVFGYAVGMSKRRKSVKTSVSNRY
jgi:diacylglycerol kinase family enzyme